MIDNNFDSVQFDRKKKNTRCCQVGKNYFHKPACKAFEQACKKWLPGFKITLYLWLCEFKKDGRKVAITVPYNTRLKIAHRENRPQFR